MNRGRDRLLTQLRPQIDDERVLQAMAAVPRDRFVPAALRRDAWQNVPLPIGNEQTISQPLVVARMCELLELRGDERILDIGTGSGYHAAVLALLGAHVWSIERHPALSEQAGENLAAAGIGNVTLLVGDGARGLPEEAPFDAINVAAAATAVPPALEDQLVAGGKLVVPVNDRLYVVERTADGVERRALERVRFVPLI
ncbi:protein-L-isoaspartate(D-aspartate) O-methyltransferase [Solirubrobacter taibaiensis]|nr:protein-L-isoaspartate(D-aspartate) O-methyltransferase [Solirubrobacter taibaiensis]